MVIFVEARERERHAAELSGYFRLRKRVFHDALGWHVPVADEQERDELDDAPCTYVLRLDHEERVVAGMRLIPTTHTTLLDLAFEGLVPDAMSFKAPTIWEISRLCVDPELSPGQVSVGVNKATLALVIGSVDYARRNGITHYLTVTEERMIDLTNSFSLGADILGRTTIDGCKVVCGLFPVNAENRALADKLRPLVAAGGNRDGTLTA